MTRLFAFVVAFAFRGIHLLAFATIVFALTDWTPAPFTWTSFWVGFVLYWVRGFGIAAGYHRYFAHRSFRTSRLFQFFLAVLGCTAMQRGWKWWAGHHRTHHRHSDDPLDPHSPISHSVWFSHVGWILSGKYQESDEKLRDFDRYWELRWLEYVHWLPGLLLAGLCYWIDGWSGVLWGFIVGTVVLYHGTFLVNSVCHLRIFGRRRYATKDASQNVWWVGMLFGWGEGWHNNHHHHQTSARQGFEWWQIDMAYYLLRFLKFFGIVWQIKEPSQSVRERNRL